MIIHEQSNVDLESVKSKDKENYAAVIKPDMKYTITYQNVSLQTKGEYIKSQLLGINWTNVALLLTVIIYSSSSQDTINKQYENNGQAVLIEKKLSEDIVELRGLLSELTQYKNFINFLQNTSLGDYQRALIEMSGMLVNNSNLLEETKRLLAESSGWMLKVDSHILNYTSDIINIQQNKFIKRNQRLNFNTAIVPGVYTYYSDGINFCLTRQMRVVAHCFIEYRNNIDMGVNLYIHLNETNSNQRGVNQGSGGWFNIHNIVIFNLANGCYNVKASTLFTDLVIDVSQFCEVYSFE